MKTRRNQFSMKLRSRDKGYFVKNGMLYLYDIPLYNAGEMPDEAEMFTRLFYSPSPKRGDLANKNNARRIQSFYRSTAIDRMVHKGNKYSASGFSK